LHLPAGRPEDNRRYLLWSTDGLPEMINGRSSTNPVFTAEVIRRVRRFPDRNAVAYLRRLGVRSVVLYPKRAEGTPWKRAENRPIRGLGVTMRVEGEAFVYEIRSPSGAGSGRALRPARSDRRSR
ncbi:MAG: hypothetical protein ACRDMA_06070, partial [Solirubrobacterales bacterium]